MKYRGLPFFADAGSRGVLARSLERKREKLTVRALVAGMRLDATADRSELVSEKHFGRTEALTAEGIVGRFQEAIRCCFQRSGASQRRNRKPAAPFALHFAGQNPQAPREFPIPRCRSCRHRNCTRKPVINGYAFRSLRQRNSVHASSHERIDGTASCRPIAGGRAEAALKIVAKSRKPLDVCFTCFVCDAAGSGALGLPYPKGGDGCSRRIEI